MEKQMETTVMLGFYGDNGKENGNYYNIEHPEKVLKTPPAEIICHIPELLGQ